MSALATGNRAVSELVLTVGGSQPTVSEHLAQLRKVGLVTYAKRGRERVYCLEMAPLHDITDWLRSLETFWDDRFERLGYTIQTLQQEEDT